jgi:hypothetical protein
LYGPISGYLQTPSGGTPGTTSDKRPTFEELGMDNVGIIDAAVAAGKGAHDLYVGARIVRLQSDTTLDETLISQNQTYPAGSSVEADVKLDWYRAGYRHRFYYLYDEKAYIGVYPALELGLFDFHYQLQGQDGTSTDRKYLHGTMRLGVESEWRPAGRFSVSAGIHSSIPVPTFIFSVHATGKYQLWAQDSRGGTVFLGVAYDLIDFEDSQEVPNHIRAEMGPMIQIGFEIGF